MNAYMFVGTIFLSGCLSGVVQGLITTEGHWWWCYVAAASEKKPSRQQAKTAELKVWVPGAILLSVLGGVTAVAIVLGLYFIDVPVHQVMSANSVTWGMYVTALVTGFGGTVGSKRLVDNAQWNKALPKVLMKEKRPDDFTLALAARTPEGLMQAS